MAVQAQQHPRFDFESDEPYSYGAEHALTEREPSVEELEAAVKETPPRPSMLHLSNGQGRTSSEPRAIGDVIDEGEKMLPLGSPSLRHTKGRLEHKNKMSPHGESYADVIKHEPSSPTTPSKPQRVDEITPTKNADSARAVKDLASPTITRKPVAQRVDGSNAANGHNYANAIKTAPETDSPAMDNQISKGERKWSATERQISKDIVSAAKADPSSDLPTAESSTSVQSSSNKDVDLARKATTPPKQAPSEPADLDSQSPAGNKNLIATTDEQRTASSSAQHTTTSEFPSLTSTGGRDAVDATGPSPVIDTNGHDSSTHDSYADIAKHEPVEAIEHVQEYKQQPALRHSHAQDKKEEEEEEDETTRKDDDTGTAKAHGSPSDTANKASEKHESADQSNTAEDSADTATAVSDDDTAAFEGRGQNESSPSKRTTQKPHSSNDNTTSKALQQALNETATLPDTSKTSSDDNEAEGLLYENFHSRSGTNLTSIPLEPAFDESLAEAEKPHPRKATKSTLVSGRRAGAGWARSAIRWAPLNVPLQRRLQTLAVLGHSLSIPGMLALFFALCAVPIFWPILLPYLIYVLLSRAPTDGKLAHRSEWLRKSKFWSLFASYFPARLHRTVELEPTRKYIFGYHPHGIISHGAFAAFTTEALGFGQLFPGITNSLLTLDSNFRVPIYRDWALRIGLASVSRESCENLLSRGGPNGEGMGRAITIVIGGARESLDAKPGTLNLVLAKRKGFVKLAVRAGADLVPVLAFGESDIYEQIDSTTHPWIHKGQMLVKKFMGFTVPLFHARGIFNYDVGIMPYRRPINIVVGRPIRTVQSKKPDPKYVDELHKQYTDELLHIWEEWKDTFAPDRKGELKIVE